MASTIRFEKGGKVKAVWDDRLAPFFEKAFGPEFAAARRRASIIMTVETGRFAGCFFADMSYLYAITDDTRHAVCLWPPRPLENDCKRDEVSYIERNYIGASAQEA